MSTCTARGIRFMLRIDYRLDIRVGRLSAFKDSVGGHRAQMVHTHRLAVDAYLVVVDCSHVQYLFHETEYHAGVEVHRVGEAFEVFGLFRRYAVHDKACIFHYSCQWSRYFVAYAVDEVCLDAVGGGRLVAGYNQFLLCVAQVVPFLAQALVAVGEFFGKLSGAAVLSEQ